MSDVLPRRRLVASFQSAQRSLAPPAPRSIIRKSPSLAAVNTMLRASFSCCDKNARKALEGNAAVANRGTSSKDEDCGSTLGFLFLKVVFHSSAERKASLVPPDESRRASSICSTQFATRA